MEPDPRLSIRVGLADEHDLLRQIESDADRIFESVGIGPFSMEEEADYLERAAVVLVAGRPPVGFVSVELVDGTPHVWQLAVHPDHGRQGLGRALMEAAADWARQEGFAAMTLTTYRDVPWNAPFYETLGYVELDKLSPGLRAIREHERAIGDDDFGLRIAMRLLL